MEPLSRPIPDSYWVRPGRLLAGEYPGAKRDPDARKKLAQLVDAGVTFFLDLTEPGEYNLNPYTPLLPEFRTCLGGDLIHERMSILDGWTPTVEGMCQILDTIDAALQQGHVVYVHCWGGIGRTGTVIGCYLVRHGMDSQAALDEIARLRAGTPDGTRRAPETARQEAMVLNWDAQDCTPTATENRG